jgi:hypothetical protein
MKRLLQLGFVFGFAGTLAAAYFVPWISYARFVTEADVVANGGRSERFVIRLPADRIEGSHEGQRHGIAEQADAGSTAVIEHFKLRDVTGNVLGVATRHWVVTASGPTASWVLAIPARGTVAASGSAEAPGAVANALRELGWSPGQAVSGSASLVRVPAGRSVATTGEFGGIALDIVETLTVSGIDGAGAIRGTITLDTVGRRGQ